MIVLEKHKIYDGMTANSHQPSSSFDSAFTVEGLELVPTHPVIIWEACIVPLTTETKIGV